MNIKKFLPLILCLLLTNFANAEAFTSDTPDPTSVTLSVVYKASNGGYGRLNNPETYKKYYGTLSYGNAKGSITLIEWDLDGDGKYNSASSVGDNLYEFVFTNAGTVTASINVHYSSGATEYVEIPNIEVTQGLDSSILDQEESSISSVDLTDTDLSSFYIQINPDFSGKYKLKSANKKLRKLIKCGNKTEFFDTEVQKWIDRFNCKVSSRNKSRLIKYIQKKGEDTFFYDIRRKGIKGIENNIPVKFTTN